MAVTILRIVLGVALGAGFGAVLGSARSCETGGCPLTANPRRGAIYGGLMGLLIAFAFAPASKPVIEADSGIVEVTSSAQFAELVQASEKPVFAYFHAPWCGACRQSGPIVNELARNHAGAVLFLGIDTDKNSELAREHAVQYLPTSLVFREGREAARIMGTFDKGQVLHELLPPDSPQAGPS
ncbi:MAG: DUF6132 family protein [Candidatus Hydrogenedentales bacterium]|jgi:thioredoxin 1